MRLQSGIPSIEHLLELPPALTLSLVVSLDGQLCGHDGSSRSISGPEDLDWLRRLRAASDAIVVGGDTAEIEHYQQIRVRPEYATARAEHGLGPHPELFVLRRSHDLDSVLRSLGPRVLLEAGLRLHRALASHIERVWLSHSPTIVGDRNAPFALPLDGFALSERWCGTSFVFSRWDRVSPR